MLEGDQEATADQERVETPEPQEEVREAPLIGELQGKLAAAEAQAAEYLDSWRRSTAELSNARKRMQREQTELTATATARVMERLLPIIDDVDRAIAAVPGDGTAADWAEGFRLIQHKLHGLLESEGARPIPTAGQMFDPARHFAVTHEVVPGFDEGQIIAEVARGYTLGDRVLRPSMVRVAKEMEA